MDSSRKDLHMRRERIRAVKCEKTGRYTNTAEIAKAKQENREPVYYHFDRNSFCSPDGLFSTAKYQAHVTESGSRFIACEAIFQVLAKQFGGVTEVRYGKNKFRYIVNHKEQVALLGCLVLRDGLRGKRTGPVADTFKRATTPANAELAIRALLLKKECAGFALAVPFGTQKHECCLFVRYKKEANSRRHPHQAVVYDPSLDQSRDITRVLVKCLGPNASVAGYNDYPTSSQSGNCSALTWCEIYNFMTNAAKNPLSHPENFTLRCFNVAKSKFIYPTELATELANKKVRARELKDLEASAALDPSINLNEEKAKLEAMWEKEDHERS